MVYYWVFYMNNKNSEFQSHQAEIEGKLWIKTLQSKSSSERIMSIKYDEKNFIFSK